jgi:hypothetical protein
VAVDKTLAEATLKIFSVPSFREEEVAVVVVEEAISSSSTLISGTEVDKAVAVVVASTTLAVSAASEDLVEEALAEVEANNNSRGPSRRRMLRLYSMTLMFMNLTSVASQSSSEDKRSGSFSFTRMKKPH